MDTGRAIEKYTSRKEKKHHLADDDNTTLPVAESTYS